MVIGQYHRLAIVIETKSILAALLARATPSSKIALPTSGSEALEQEYNCVPIFWYGPGPVELD